MLTVTATVLVALGFAPVREWARGLANRWVYGERQAPYEVLTALGSRLAAALTPDELLPAIAHAAAVGVGAAAAEVRLASGPCAEDVARTTSSTHEREAPLVVPVRAGDTTLAEIAVTPRPGFPLTRRHRRLLDHLAQQSAPALANARLVEELKASRRRLVSVADDERRRLERDLHDGAQAQLVAVTLRLRALAAGLPDGQAAAVEQVREQVTGTMATLRDLARGVFPPQLAEAGVGAAVRSHLAKTGSPARLADRVPPGVRGQPGGRGRTVVLRVGGAAERRQARRHRRRRRALRRRRPAAGRSPRRRPRLRPAQRHRGGVGSPTLPTGWRPSTAPSRSIRPLGAGTRVVADCTRRDPPPPHE